MADLALLLDAQEETNMRLDELDDRFIEFFRKMERDRLDMLEMLREQRGGAGEGGAGGTEGGEEEDSGGGFLSAAAAASAIAGVVAAAFMNQLGAVFLNKIPGALSSLGTKVSEFSKGLGEKVSQRFSNINATIIEKLDEFKKSMQAFGATVAETVKDLAGRAKAFISDKASKVAEKTGQLIDSAKSAGASIVSRAQQFGSAISDRASNIAESVKGKATTLVQQGGQFVERVGQSRVGQAVQTAASGTAKFAGSSVSVANRALVPIAAVTSGVAGYKMAQETPEMSTTGKVAVGTAGAASAFFGGFADFVKLVTVDAAIEAGQRMGVISADGYLQRVQDVSVQRDVFDPMIRTARDSLTEAMEKGTMETVAGSSPTVVVQNNNTNAPSITNNSNMTSPPVSSPVSNNGTRSDAWSMG